MIRKILLLLCSSALVSSGVIGSDYYPATSVSYSSLSAPIDKAISTPVFEKSITGPIGYTKIIQSPPVYQSILTTKESNFRTPDGTRLATYTKSYDTAYSKVKHIESKSAKDGDVIANTAAHSPIIYHSGPAYTLSSPLVHTVHSPTLTKSESIPISYITQNFPLTKTIISPSVAYSTPESEKSKILQTGLSSYSSNSPVYESQPIKTTITYSEAPLVSHMSFTGLGASYAW